MDKYDKIRHLSRPFDAKHPPMSLHNRAAQFAPFDALTGLTGVLGETSRLTTQRPELTEETKHLINSKLILLKKHLKEQPLITVTYFVPDIRKEGGSFCTTAGIISKIDLDNERLKFDDETEISFEDILDIISEFSEDPEM